MFNSLATMGHQCPKRDFVDKGAPSVEPSDISVPQKQTHFVDKKLLFPNVKPTSKSL